MKNLLIIISGILLSILFTGCSTSTFNQAYTNGKVKNNLHKVSNKISISYVKNEENIISKRPNSFLGGLRYFNVDVGTVNNGVLKEFLSQYFSNISNPEVGDIKIISKITNFEHENFFGGKKIDIYLSTKVYYKSKLILDKKYISVNQKEIFIAGLDLDGLSYAEELFHKVVLSIYENQFKPDLLTALKENI